MQVFYLTLRWISLLLVILEMNKSPGMLTCIVVLPRITAISTKEDLKSIINQTKQVRKALSGLYLKTTYNNYD